MPVADLKALEEELDEECARELAGAFLEDAGAAMSGIQTALGEKNAADLKAHVHGLKGCCRTIKAAAAEQVCTDLEMAAAGGDWAKIESLCPQLSTVYEQVCTFIHSYLGG